MNNGILAQDIYGRLGFDANMPRTISGFVGVVSMPYHYPTGSWKIDAKNLVLIFDTSKNSSASVGFTMAGSPNNCSIDWGDGSIDTVYSASGNVFYSHRYASHGTYVVQVVSKSDVSIKAPRFSSSAHLAEIISFGDLSGAVGPDYLNGFSSCVNLTKVPKNLPSQLTALQNAFLSCSSLNDPNIGFWNVSNIANFQSVFSSCVRFNIALDSWNVRKVTNFSSMFSFATSFNSSLSGWALGADVSGVNCDSMLYGATSFNQPIGSWDTSQVTNMSSMLRQALAFNQPIGTWNVSKVTNFTNMFYITYAFNQDLGNWSINTISNVSMAGMFGNATVFNNGGSSGINNWNTTNVTDMSTMFTNASAFNQPLNNWNTSNVTNMNIMFQGASFNQPLNNWNVRKVTNFGGMFNGATSFNSSLSGWAPGADTAGTTCRGMFQSATTFNQDISNWNTSKVTNMQDMFLLAPAFNQPIGSWDTSNNTTFWRMFNGATSFNQPIGSWNTSKATTMIQMFTNASAFNQDISGWNLARINVNTGLDDFMTGKTGANALSTTNYDALLIGWNNNKLIGANGIANWRTDLRPNFGGAKYTAGGAAAAARAALVSYGWTITDGGTA